jgi:predicted RNase H-like HicB family nuclease
MEHIVPDRFAKDRENRSYIALVRKEDGTDYWVDMPDLPGCVTCAATKDEAIAHFETILMHHIEGMREDDMPLPRPRALKDVAAAQENTFLEAFVVEISV